MEMAKKDTNNGNEVLSKSKAKREARQKEIAKEKKEKLVSRIITTTIVTIFVAIFAVAIGFQIYKSAIRTTSNSDFSAGLTEAGLIDGVETTSTVSLADYEGLVVPMNEVAATAEEVDSNIQSTLSSHKAISDDSSIEIKSGDTVNIDYVGSIDGVEFEGGNSNGEGYDLEIGSGTFIEGFEDQLIGHTPGEDVVVKATFPEDYTSADLAGKKAEFAVTIHGVYVTPELTDTFVQENFSDVASTADEYRAYVENNFYRTHLEEYLHNYILENSTISSYPKTYVKALKSITKYNDEFSMQYYNQMASQYGMETSTNVWDTIEGVDNEIEYEHDLTKRAEEMAKQALVYQAIYEKAGLNVDFDAIIAEMTETNGEDYVTNMKDTYGQGYMIQTEIQSVVLDYLADNANVQ
ncbi:MAG: FKBP-type peptidyl-prolyl cis-trans isomerase [Lachnospiraceae bacterium]|nr:FKBP-type peptidyl-prolyl cis-trans isomerase [Lachnospiraceae bacterium]